MRAFTPDELAAWITEQLGEVAAETDYQLAPHELTAKSYRNLVLAAEGKSITERQAYARLERLFEAGAMKKKQVKIGRGSPCVYWPADIDAAKGGGE